MARLAVKEARCIDPQERLGDEIYVKIDGHKFDLQDSFEGNDAWQWSDGDTERFSDIISPDVGNSARIELWERDTGDDDHIRSVTVANTPGGEFIVNMFSSGGSAEYVLILDWI